MLIPLTPINEAWNLEPNKEKSRPKVPLGYSNNDTTKYEIGTKYVPHTLDITIQDNQVIENLLPITNAKRTNIVTHLLSEFFSQSNYRKHEEFIPASSPPSSSPSSYSMNNRTGSVPNQEEYFQSSPISNDESVQLIIMALVAYILIDKLMTIWARSS